VIVIYLNFYISIAILRCSCNKNFQKALQFRNAYRVTEGSSKPKLGKNNFSYTVPREVCVLLVSIFA
jgi:hypothetical protein